MRSISSKKSLRLHKETFRVLSDHQLSNVAGGGETQTCGEDPDKTVNPPTPSGLLVLGCVGTHRNCPVTTHPVYQS